MTTHKGNSNRTKKTPAILDHKFSTGLLSQEAIAEFRRLWKKKYKKELSEQEAVSRAHEFLGVVRLVHRAHARTKRQSDREIGSR